MLIKSAENLSHFYHLSSFSNQAYSECLTLIILHTKRAIIIHTLTMTYDMQKKTKGLACYIYQNKAKCVRLCFFKLIYAHIHDL